MTASDQTNAEVSDERLRERADALWEQLLPHMQVASHASGAHSAYDDKVAAIGFIMTELNHRSVTSQASEGEWKPTPEFAAWFRSYLGEGIHVAFRKASDSRAADQIWKLIRDMPAGEWPAIVDFVASAMIDGMAPRIVAPVSKRVERLETVEAITLREELAVLLQDYWDTGVEHGREGQDSEAVSPMRVATKQAIWATLDEMLRRASAGGEE